MGGSGQMCVEGTISCDDYAHGVVGSLQSAFLLIFLSRPQFCHLQSGYNDNNNIVKSHLTKGLGYNKLTTLGGNNIKSEWPLTIAHGI